MGSPKDAPGKFSVAGKLTSMWVGDTQIAQLDPESIVVSAIHDEVVIEVGRVNAMKQEEIYQKQLDQRLTQLNADLELLEINYAQQRARIVIRIRKTKAAMNHPEKVDKGSSDDQLIKRVKKKLVRLGGPGKSGATDGKI